MKKTIQSVLILVLLASLAYAQDARYEFDEINVIYAAEFAAKPSDVKPDNWLAKIAGGTDLPINVIYGIV
jgi:hypothetical protein